MKNTVTKRHRLLTLILALVVALTTIVPAGMSVRAEGIDVDGKDTVATPGDADGIYKDSDGYFYYYKDGKISDKSGWIEVSSKVSVKLDDNHRVEYMLVADNGSKISKYSSASKQMAAYTNSTIVLADKKLHYAGADGVLVTKTADVSDGKGTTYVLNSGVVTAKLVKSGEARKYYSYSASTAKWVLLKNTYKKVSNVLYYFAGNGTASKMYVYSTSQLYKYSNSKMVLVKSGISTVDSSKIYAFGSNGKKITKTGWYSVTGGSKVLVNSKGIVTAKLSAAGKSKKYYAYDYKNLKWVLKKNKWINVSGVDYYFGANGVASRMYNTKTKKLTLYKSGKLVAAKNQIMTLKDGKYYLFNASAVKVTKSGWRNVNTTDKAYVSSKGYVTMKFSTKTGKLTKYDGKTKKWVLMKVSSYKIGSKTYYFDAKGKLAKNTIVGNKKTGYFYVDETGCKVTSREIQLAVNFVKEHTNDSMSREQKLKSCFIYLSRNYPYLRDYVVPTDASRFTYYCIDMLTNNHGNCYRCAATFATVATVLGYKARVTCGQVTNLQGDGFTIHGWTELWRPEDNEWVVYDVSMQRNWPARDYYHVLMKNYYPTHRIIGPRARLTVKNGKVNWRWLADSELGDH